MSARIWSDEQSKIFEEFAHGRSSFCVEARAGSGKSTVAAHGISLAPEEKKCYAVFNKRNVEEFKAKIQDPRCQVMSLNGLGHRFVLRQWAGVRPDSDVEFDRIQAVINSNASWKAKKYAPRGTIKDIVEYAKNTKPFAKLKDLVDLADAKGWGPEDYQEEQGWTTEILCDIAYRAMEMAKTRDTQNRISFTDQLWLPVVMKWAQPWFNLLVLDEAQDLNATQLILAQRAVKKSGRLVMIFDMRQAIYQWRGADSQGVERLRTELRAKSYPLTVTYRCPRAVVALASVLVPDYKHAPDAPDGVVRNIPESKLVTEAAAGDFVVSRFNAPLMKLCLEVLKTGRRAYIEGRDIGATLQAIHGKLKASDIKSYIAAADQWAADRINRVSGDPDSDTFKAAIQVIEDQADTLKALAEASQNVAEIGGRLASLFEDSANDASRCSRSVVFSSIHKAKGLEAHRVFILAETLKRASWTSTVNPECNLAYVAITRARHELIWVGPGGPGGSTVPPLVEKAIDKTE